jgi:hypothetical protein
MQSYQVLIKDGVRFDITAPAGLVIVGALWMTAQILRMDLTITSGTDGNHSGPEDPHKKGEAIDSRSQGYTLEVKNKILNTMMGILGWERFYGFLESPDTPNEHFHFQKKKGTVYP